MHPYLTQYREANMQEWKRTDLVVIDATEMREIGRRCVITGSGLEIGRSHIKKPPARHAGSISGPHRQSKWKNADWWIYRVMVPLGLVTVGALLIAEMFA